MNDITTKHGAEAAAILKKINTLEEQQKLEMELEYNYLEKDFKGI